MRNWVFILAFAVAACASHHAPPKPAYEAPVPPLDPPTQAHCQALIQDLQQRMNTVDFNQDRKKEVTKAIKKANVELAKGNYAKCVKYAKGAIFWSR